MSHDRGLRFWLIRESLESHTSSPDCPRAASQRAALQWKQNSLFPWHRSLTADCWSSSQCPWPRQPGVAVRGIQMVQAPALLFTRPEGKRPSFTAPAECHVLHMYRRGRGEDRSQVLRRSPASEAKGAPFLPFKFQALPTTCPLSWPQSAFLGPLRLAPSK